MFCLVWTFSLLWEKQKHPTGAKSERNGLLNNLKVWEGNFTTYQILVFRKWGWREVLLGSSESCIFIQCLNITPGKKSDITHTLLRGFQFLAVVASRKISCFRKNLKSCLVQFIVASWIRMQKMETGRSFIVEGSRRGAKCHLFFRRN